ncbi:hypothetical protein T02_1617 [Trichinella nativa]|uniref:Uncharacterized protein n=1 Tax=Trichinella nativa TaxID=6335 RepID=A0A0V1KY26_9BILA|nr:hypothetical protein T02_1617 [Trichinella nativa]
MKIYMQPCECINFVCFVSFIGNNCLLRGQATSARCFYNSGKMIQHFLKEHKMRMDPSDTKSPILFSSDGRAELTRAPVCDECLVKLALQF